MSLSAAALATTTASMQIVLSSVSNHQPFGDVWFFKTVDRPAQLRVFVVQVPIFDVDQFQCVVAEYRLQVPLIQVQRVADPQEGVDLAVGLVSELVEQLQATLKEG